MVESTGAISVAIILLLLWDLVTHPKAVDVTSAISYQVLLFMIPSFSLVTLLGFLVRRQSHWVRFGLNSLLNAFVTAVITIWFHWLISSQTGGATDLVLKFWLTSPVVIGLAFQIGLVVTYWLVVSPQATSLSKTQYQVNPVVASKKKKRK
jgi:hypothetical protein